MLKSDQIASPFSLLYTLQIRTLTQVYPSVVKNSNVFFWSLVVALRAQWIRRDPLMRGMSFACVMGVTSLLIHSWVDFNLQIPANAVYFMILLAFGWISLFLDRRTA